MAIPAKFEGGKRMMGNIKKQSLDSPSISVITVVYNGEDFLEKTICGILNQNYKNFEYIIIDGGSSDGTLDIIKKYEDKIDYWISEKDSGIYDAMNKGIDLSKGDWINFMNAGDTFYNSEVLKEIFSNQEISADLIYGNAVLIEKDGKFSNKIASTDLDNLWKQAKFGHESLFVKSKILKENKFNLYYSVAADYDFIMKCFHTGYKFKKYDLNVLLFTTPFFSREHWVKSTLETWGIARKYKGGLKVDWFYFSNFFIGIFVRFIKNILPENFYKILKKVGNYSK